MCFPRACRCWEKKGISGFGSAFCAFDRNEPVQANILGDSWSEQSLEQTVTCLRHPEVHSCWWEAQRSRWCRKGHLPSHLLWDAWQLVIWWLLQERGYRVGLGTSHSGKCFDNSYIFCFYLLFSCTGVHINTKLTILWQVLFVVIFRIETVSALIVGELLLL